MKLFQTLLFGIGLLMLTACSSARNYFVLLPDHDGKVGEIVIENEAGRQVLTTKGAVAEVVDRKTLPQHQKPMSSTEIRKMFQGAIETMPPLSVRFILYFKFGQAQLTRSSQRYFKENAEQISNTAKERHPCDIRVVGHTDTAGSRALNFKLGMARARVVVQKLIALGIPADQIEMVSHSEKDLRIHTPDNTAMAQNRRAEIIIH